MSVPAPIAIPMSARMSAGASLIPSPTIATLCPCSCKARICASFSVGRTSEMTVSIPTCLRIASAVTRLSPVSMTTEMPISRSLLIAARLSSRTVSATAMMPASLPSRAKRSGVLPSSENACILSRAGLFSGKSPFSARNAALPAR